MSTRQWNSEQVGARWESLGGDKPDVPSVGGGVSQGSAAPIVFLFCVYASTLALLLELERASMDPGGPARKSNSLG